MNFNKVVRTILEEVESRPPFELLSELNYSKILLLQSEEDNNNIRGYYIGKNVFGQIFGIKEGKLLYYMTKDNKEAILVKGRNDKEIENIKKNWRKSIIVGGSELRRYLNSAPRETVIDNDSVKYVVNDLSIIPKFNTLFTGTEVYLEPTEWEKSPQEVKDVFTDMFKEL